MRRAAVLVLLLAACGGHSGPQVVPRLPGGGTANLPEPVAPADKPKGDDPWSGRDDLIQPPAPAPAPALTFAEPARFSLRNGLHVLVVEDHSLPTVGMQLAVRAGRRDVPLDKVGLESFAAALLTRGTRRRSADEIAKVVEQAGAQLAASAGYEATTVSCAVTSRRLDACLTLVPELVESPAFAADEVDKVREKLSAQVADGKKNAAKLATIHFENILFGDDHPRGRPTSERTVQSISRDDLVAWHRDYFHPNNATLVVVGDVQAKALRRRLGRAFSRWRPRKTGKRPTFKTPEVKGIEVRLVDQPGAAQAQVRIGRPGVTPEDGDYYPALVGAAMLGDEGGRLTSAARARFGDAAAASASLDRGFGVRGALMAGARVPADSAVAGARMLMTELGKLADPGPQPAEVARVGARLAGHHLSGLQTSVDLAGALLAAEVHRLGDGFVRGFAHKLGSVTPEAVKEAARSRFETEDLVVVLVGPASRIEPQLSRAGWVYEKVSASDPASKAEREEIEEAKNAPVDPAAEKRARALLDKALAAKGGRKRLRAIKTFQWHGDAKVQLPGGEIHAEIDKRYVAPDKLRLDLDLLDVKVEVTTVVDGQKAWVRQKSPKGARILNLPPSEVDAARAQLWRDQDFVLLRHREKGTVVKPLPDQSIGGVPHYAIQLTSAGGKYTVTLLLNKKTLLLEGMDYTDQGTKAKERLSDYRKVNGIQIAHHRRTESPQMKLEADLSKVRIDAKVDPSLFVKPKQDVSNSPK